MVSGKKKSDAEFLEEARQACEGEPYEVVRVYRKNKKAHLSIYCERHDMTFEVEFYLFIDGRRCRKCGYWSMSKKLRNSLQDFVGYLDDNPPGNFEYLELFHRGYPLLLIECLDCGHIFERRPESHKRSKGCPECSSGDPSKGHLLVREALETLGFVKNKDFYEEKEFDSCRNKRPLPFDFYLPEHRCLIEYQGEQHFKPVGIFGGEERLVSCQEHDHIKKQWAEDKDYLLLRIPYTVDRLDLIVKGLIERLGL